MGGRPGRQAPGCLPASPACIPGHAPHPAGPLFTGDTFAPWGGLSSSESQRQHHGHQQAWGKSLKPQGLVVRDGIGVPSAEFYWHLQWNWREANSVY